VSVILCLACVGCRSPARSIEESDPPLTRALLGIAKQAAQHRLVYKRQLPDRSETRRRLAEVVARARSRLARAGDHPVETLNRLIFDELGFHREVDDTSVRWMLLPAVLAEKRGSCLGLAGLYLSLSEHLDLPIRGVLVPDHFFVRHERGEKRRDLELLKRGKQMPRSWYLRKYRVPEDNPLYLRSLKARESLAVFRFNLANALREKGRHPQALALYKEVVAILPDFAEAQANLGLTYHRLGRLPRAERAYLRARAANEGLPGLQRNLDALRKQQRGQRAGADVDTKPGSVTNR
jgi:regulator of sirC expression with transglutaminase-like and TPR domain